MHKNIKIILLLIGIGVVSILGLCFYSGVFTPVKASLLKAGPYAIVYREHQGSYATVMKDIDDVVTKLAREGIITTTTAGIYYDDPAKVAEKDLRSQVGALLDEQYLGKIPTLLQKGFLIREIPETWGTIVEFPMTTPFSVIVGMWKAYPAMEQLQRQHQLVIKGEAIELYDTSHKKISYIMQVTNYIP